MCEVIANRIVDRLMQLDAIDSEKRDIYIYGLIYILQTSINLAGMMLIGSLLGLMVDTTFFLIGFLIVRSSVGGVHCKSENLCFIYSYIVFGLNLALIKFFMPQLLILIVASFSAFVIYKYAPIDHPNRRFSKADFAYFRRKSLLALGFIILVYLMFLFLHSHILSSILMGVFTAAISLYIAKLKRKEDYYEA